MMNVNNLINNYPYVMQNSYGAALTIIAANTLFVEAACRIALLACDIFDEYVAFSSDTIELEIMGYDVPVPERGTIKVGIVLTGFPLSMVTMNITLNKLIKFPFNSWAVAGLSTLSMVSYTALRLAYAE